MITGSSGGRLVQWTDCQLFWGKSQIDQQINVVDINVFKSEKHQKCYDFLSIIEAIGFLNGNANQTGWLG
jgi:hypothetical protein